MKTAKRRNRGKLVPTLPTGVEYQVEHGIEIIPEVRQHGRAAAPASRARWEKCSIRSAHAHMIPEGSYFLHSDDGRVHQLKLTRGVWQYLVLA
ncbi:MAG: hypothetical protein ACRD5L_02220 [Bryobacteraceae bacterium]